MWVTTFSPTPAGSHGNESDRPHFGWLKCVYSEEELAPFEYEEQLDLDDAGAVETFLERASKSLAIVQNRKTPDAAAVEKALANINESLNRRTESAGSAVVR